MRTQGYERLQQFMRSNARRILNGSEMNTVRTTSTTLHLYRFGCALFLPSFSLVRPFHTSNFGRVGRKQSKRKKKKKTRNTSIWRSMTMYNFNLFGSSPNMRRYSWTCLCLWFMKYLYYHKWTGWSWSDRDGIFMYKLCELLNYLTLHSDSFLDRREAARAHRFV